MGRPKQKTPEPPPFPKVIETFGNPTWTLDQLVTHHKEPSCWNSIVSLHRYRVTAEVIEEPIEVLRARMLKLWRECNNHHHWGPLESAAIKLGFELDHKEFGKDRKR